MAGPSHLVVLGTSAGGMSALTRLVAQLPASLNAAVLVVQHLAPDSSGTHLVARLASHTSMRCQLATHQAPLETGTLYLAPPDRHLLVRDNQILVTKGPHENGYRPAADALFRSAAVEFGPNAIGVVLTGMLHDGTAGLDFIKRCGGIAVVQDPADAEFSSMPESALRAVEVDHIVPLDLMGSLLVDLVRTTQPDTQPVPNDLRVEATIAERVVGTTNEVSQIGELAPLTCPDCGGTLWEMKHGSILRFRCHTGHAFTADVLLAKSQQAMEETLWVALRMMEERKNLLSNIAGHGETPINVYQQERIQEIKLHVNRLREFLLNGASAPTT